MDLFPKNCVVGIFRGFSEGGLEFHADLVLPYRSDFQVSPMHGQFVLVQLESPQEAVLGRIASLSAEGKLSAGTGEEFNIRAVREDRPVPEDLREEYLKYRVNIRVLGVLRVTNGDMNFVPSHRRLPHVGSTVAFASDSVLQEIAGHNIDGDPIGCLALGEFNYSAGSSLVQVEDWMQVKSPTVLVKFPVDRLVSRRSFIFARAGFGKSNLNKLLFSSLYKQTPTTVKRGVNVPVGTIIFDPDGEYFWPDDKGRPGLCDVPHLEDKLVVFTSRHSTSPFYQSFVAGGIKLDIRRLKPSDVIAIALSPEKQDQQNVAKLRGLNESLWEELVNLVYQHGNQTPPEDISKILHLDAKQEAEAFAARSNMTAVVRMLHDPSSRLMDSLMTSLAEGKICVVDLSQMRGNQGFVLSGLILRRIFERNQIEFTAAEPKTIPTIAVIEEAQSVLTSRATAAEPYIEWVKEGRKYDLGALLVTQQPGSIPSEILSQGDNWFIFHLLSAGDLTSVKKANAHFSDDLLGSLLNEPIPGQGVFWSSVGGKPYPIPLRVLSFEKLYPVLDPKYNRPRASTYARFLRGGSSSTGASTDSTPSAAITTDPTVLGEVSEEPAVDLKATWEIAAINALKEDDLINRIESDGAAYGSIKAFLKDKLPQNLDGLDDLAYNLVSKALDAIYGHGHWSSFKKAKSSGSGTTTYVRADKRR